MPLHRRVPKIGVKRHSHLLFSVPFREVCKSRENVLPGEAAGLPASPNFICLSLL